MAHHQVLIIGGGTAGLAVGAMLRKKPNPPGVTIIEPSDKHYYQPIWTLVGAGVFEKEISERPEADFIPDGATWIQEKVTAFDPDNHTVELSNGDKESYDYLVVAAGIQIDWDRVPGLKESIAKPGTGVCSNYAYDTVDSTWANLRTLKRGNAIFTHPSGAIKCGGAPIKITFLAADYWRKQGVKSQINVKFMKAGGGIFAVQKYIPPLNRVADDYGIERHYRMDLVEVRADAREAVFKNLDSGETVTEPYDMLHVSPFMSAPDFIKSSPLAAESGWVDVDKHTTQHMRYPNVFALGDCANLPTSKTGAAIRKQAPVTVTNLMAHMEGHALNASYDGYTSCPLVTGYGSLILAEFDYDKQPQESFPFDQATPRYSMYALKAYALPQMYWHGMLRGREF